MARLASLRRAGALSWALASLTSCLWGGAVSLAAPPHRETAADPPLGVLMKGVSPLTPWSAVSARPLSSAERLEALKRRLFRNRDHLERSSRRLTLPEAIAMGLERNPSLAKAHAGIEATRWSGVAIRREWAPSLVVGNNDPGLLGMQQQQADTLSISSPELTLEWTFFDPSRTPRVRANAASLEAERFLFDVQARSLVLNVQESYIDLQALLALEVEYRQLSAIVDHWLQLAQARRPAGASTPDVDQLLSQQLAQLILRVDTHEQVIAAASKLAQALSLPPGELVLPAEPLALQGQWTLSREETITQALRLREEIQRSLATARSLAWGAVATRKGYLPTLSLEGTGSTQSSSDTSDLNSQGAVGMNVQWTLFDGGILAAKATSQRKQQEQALQQAALDRLTVTTEVETSYAAFINSQIVVDSAIAQMESARASFLSATKSFQAGSSDATTLLQVLANTRGAVEAYCRALRKHNRSVAELERYSARWPAAAQSLLRQRVARLQVSAPASAAPGR
ncbi:MAG: TolC family protein [Cyanobacteriota bacterium]|nr:TolC family protein [Cyanobacteriota bacterium]